MRAAVSREYRQLVVLVEVNGRRRIRTDGQPRFRQLMVLEIQHLRADIQQDADLRLLCCQDREEFARGSPLAVLMGYARIVLVLRL